MVTASSGGSDWLQLWHGTDLGSALWIAEHGLNSERMRAYYEKTREFWATTSWWQAEQYAALNIAVYTKGATPAILGAKVPLAVVDGLLLRTPPLVGRTPEDGGYCFQPETFVTINAVMTDKTVTIVAEANLGN